MFMSYPGLDERGGRGRRGGWWREGAQSPYRERKALWRVPLVVVKCTHSLVEFLGEGVSEVLHEEPAERGWGFES